MACTARIRLALEKCVLRNKQSGIIRGDIIGLLIAAVMLGGLLIYGSVSGQDLPLLPSLLVIGVNVVAAFYVFKAARKRKQDSSAAKRDPR